MRLPDGSYTMAWWRGVPFNSVGMTWQHPWPSTPCCMLLGELPSMEPCWLPNGEDWYSCGGQKESLPRLSAKEWSWSIRCWENVQDMARLAFSTFFESIRGHQIRQIRHWARRIPVCRALKKGLWRSFPIYRRKWLFSCIALIIFSTMSVALSN